MLKNKQSAFTLIEILVAVGLMGLLALGIAEIYRQQMYIQDKVRDRGALEDLRNVVRSVINCQFSCVVNVTRIPVNQGRWTLTPLCDHRGLQILIADSKKKAPENQSSLFPINDGYVCLYLDQPDGGTPGSSMPPAAMPPPEELLQQMNELEELFESMKGVEPE